MNRFDTDLWSFLKGNNETSLGISERLKLAQKFVEKVEEIHGKQVFNRDLKPLNVLINLRLDGKWNGEMEITDFGIARIRRREGIKAGTSGWANNEQFTGESFGYDDFGARLLVFMILLSWNRAWSFIWDGTPTVDSAHPIEKLFLECEGWAEIPTLLTKIGSLIGSQSFLDDWALYCRSINANISIDANTQKSVDVEKMFSQMRLDKSEFITNGTKVHCQDFTNLCHSFAIVTALRR